MNARMKRLMSDYEQVKKDFTGHQYIQVTPMGMEPPERYHVTYFVNGIYLLPGGRIEQLGRHEVEIILHSDYPRYKPICKLLTPIWHPNFRGGQICIGDIWGAGESLTDIIINIGDMIQYKSWNSSSPLSADAAEWAIENKHLFPVGNLNLNIVDYGAAKDNVEIDLFDENTENIETLELEDEDSANDFEITAEELEGIEFVPTAQRMQAFAGNQRVRGRKVNLKTILVKGLLWALLGSALGFGISEISEPIHCDSSTASILGYSEWKDYFDYQEKADSIYNEVYYKIEAYCEKEGLNIDTEEALIQWEQDASAKDVALYEEAMDYSEKAVDELYEICEKEYDNDMYTFEVAMEEVCNNVYRFSTAVWFGIIALFIGLFLGIGEGVFYGSLEKALKYGLMGTGISLAAGAISGYVAQWMYGFMLTDYAAGFVAAFIRGIGWSVMGLGVGFAIGIMKPQAKRIAFCSIGGVIGAFMGGFAFNFICELIPNDVVARGTAIIIMGLLIGIGVGLLEQFAKQAWLRVIRGEFEGKEYLVFAGVTSIGNTGKNTIVLFKDKLVGPHHCDIVLEGSQYVIIDKGTPMGTLVNGMRVTRHVLRNGDTIALGNSVLVFNTR